MTLNFSKYLDIHDSSVPSAVYDAVTDYAREAGDGGQNTIHLFSVDALEEDIEYCEEEGSLATNQEVILAFLKEHDLEDVEFKIWW